jgi:phosphoglycerate dehydrogenase-like enzyme
VNGIARLFWIIDEEWPDYEAENAILRGAFPDCEIRYSKYDYAKDLEAFGYRADAILAQVYARVPAEAIARLERCKGIAVFGGGYDRVDVEAAARKGIMVTNVQRYCAEDLADYVMAAVYHCNKRVADYGRCAREKVRQGLWGAPAAFGLPSRVAGSTLLVVGTGAIGTTVAKKALALKMRVLGYDPFVSEGEMASAGIVKAGWEEGLAAADYVSLNPKYYEGTHELVKAADLARMKPTAFLINTSRGRVVREADLVEAVRGGVIAGAVVDVIANEPPGPGEAVFDCPGIVVTPHVSYISEESFRELKERAANNALAMLAGERPSDLVNDPVRM